MSLADSRASRCAQERLIAARGSVYAAFDNLDCGIDHDQALEFLNGAPHFQVLDERTRWLVAGIVMGFAIVAVESEREIRNGGPRGMGQPVADDSSHEEIAVLTDDRDRLRLGFDALAALVRAEFPEGMLLSEIAVTWPDDLPRTAAEQVAALRELESP